jgi:biotin carboxyl carrier protein
LSERDRLELLIARADATLAPPRSGRGTLRLLSPGVGWFTAARGRGDLVAPGVPAGVLLVLGRSFELVAPSDALGRVGNEPPPRTRAPVGWGDVLYEIEPIGAGEGEPDRASDRDAPAPASLAHGHGPEPSVVRSLQSGRFYLRPAPGETPFVEVGTALEPGQPIGLIEVMKTFAHVRYAGPGLPTRAKVTRVLVSDGAEVGVGDPLIEVESV